MDSDPANLTHVRHHQSDNISDKGFTGGIHLARGSEARLDSAASGIHSATAGQVPILVATMVAFTPSLSRQM